MSISFHSNAMKTNLSLISFITMIHVLRASNVLDYLTTFYSDSQLQFSRHKLHFIMPESYNDEDADNVLKAIAKIKHQKLITINSFNEKPECQVDDEESVINLDLSKDINEWLANNFTSGDFSYCKWLFEDLFSVREKLSVARPKFDSEVFLVDDELLLTEVYEIAGEKPLIFGPLDRDADPHRWNRRSDLGGQLFRASIFDYNPYVIIDDADINESTGFAVELINTLAAELNFTLNFAFPVDGSFGSLDKSTGSFNGVVGMLQRGEIDFGGITIRKTLSRSKAIDYTVAVTEHSNIYVTRKPDALASVSFTKLLDGEAWTVTAFMNLVILIAGVIIMLVLFGRRHKYSSEVIISGKQ